MCVLVGWCVCESFGLCVDSCTNVCVLLCLSVSVCTEVIMLVSGWSSVCVWVCVFWCIHGWVSGCVYVFGYVIIDRYRQHGIGFPTIFNTTRPHTAIIDVYQPTETVE